MPLFLPSFGLSSRPSSSLAMFRFHLVKNITFKVVQPESSREYFTNSKKRLYLIDSIGRMSENRILIKVLRNPNDVINESTR